MMLHTYVQCITGVTTTTQPAKIRNTEHTCKIPVTGLTIYPKRKLRKLVNKGEYADAIAFGTEIAPKFADDHDFMFIMGSTYFIVEEYEKALHYFEKALALNDRDLETLRLKTNVHLALGQREAAIGCIDRILDTEPGNDEALDLLERLRNT